MVEAPLVYRVPEAARLLALGQNEVRDLLHRGDLAGWRAGAAGYWRIPRQGIEDYFARQLREAAEEREALARSLSGSVRRSVVGNGVPVGKGRVVGNSTSVGKSEVVGNGTAVGTGDAMGKGGVVGNGLPGPKGRVVGNGLPVSNGGTVTPVVSTEPLSSQTSEHSSKTGAKRPSST